MFDRTAKRPALSTILPPISIIYICALLLIGAKIYFMLSEPPAADEGYYWLWGRHLSWSYYDHPPLGGWMQGLVQSTLGDGLVAARSVTIIPVFIMVYIAAFWIKRLDPAVRRLDAFALSVCILLGSGWIFIFTTYIFHDYLMFAAGMTAAHFFALFCERVYDDRLEIQWRWLYLACVALGLAGLSKYNSVLLGIGFGGWVLLSAKGRSLLSSPHLYLAAAISILMQFPTLYWNHLNDWPSFRYNLHDRIGQADDPSIFNRLQKFILEFVLFLSPVLCIALFRFVVRTSANPALAAFQGPGRIVFILSTGIFLALCASNTVPFYWNASAVIFFLPVAIFFIRSEIEIILHLTASLLMVVFATGFFGLTANSEPKTYEASFVAHKMHDPDIVGQALIAEEKALDTDMVLTTDYRTASILALTMNRPDIASLGPRKDMFDFWFKPEDHKGQDALVLSYKAFPETKLMTDVFEDLKFLRTIDVVDRGVVVEKYDLFYAKNYSGEGPQ